MQTNTQFWRHIFSTKQKAHSLSLSVQLKSLSLLPVGASRAANSLGEAVSLAETTRSLASRGKTTQLTMLHHGVHDPVDLRVAADGLVRRVGEDDLEELVGRVRANPVGVEHSQCAATTTNALLKNNKPTLKPQTKTI